MLNQGQVMDSQGTYPYFTDYVKQMLLDDFDQDTVFQGGLKVYTTLDPAHQAEAEDAVRLTLDTSWQRELEGALVAIDNPTPATSRPWWAAATTTGPVQPGHQARRQPGSSFKTFTLAAAIREGMNPNVSLNCNSPLQVTPTWTVQNFGNISYGTVTLAYAFAVSSNTGFVQVAEAIGAERIVDVAHAMGIDEHLDAYASITLGTIGVPPVQMAEAYATLAADGIHRDSVAITRIEDRNGNILYEHVSNT